MGLLYTKRQKTAVHLSPAVCEQPRKRHTGCPAPSLGFTPRPRSRNLDGPGENAGAAAACLEVLLEAQFIRSRAPQVSRVIYARASHTRRSPGARVRALYRQDGAPRRHTAKGVNTVPPIRRVADRSI